MNSIKDTIKDQSGVIATLSLIGVMVICLTVVTVTSQLAISELQMSGAGGVIDQTYYAAESGLNEALYRLIAYPGPGSYNFDINGVTVTADISSHPSNPYQRIITATAVNTNGNKRSVRISANTSAYSGGFDYAVQGGEGGVYLDNNSLIDGDVYSNAGILPASGGATGNIDGNAYIQYFDSFGSPYILDQVNVSGEAHAHTIIDSDINGQAFYFDDTTIINTDVSGTTCPNAGCHPFSPDPGPRPLPLDESDVNIWKTDIDTYGGSVLFPNPGDCPPSLASGFYCVTSSATLGTKKIVGDFYIGNGATLVLEGNLWVTGDIIMDNNGTIEIDPGLGNGSAVMIADGIIEVNNNYTISGTGDPASFVLLVSMSPSITPPAVYAANNSDSIVFAALKGRLRVKNNGALNAAAAYELWLEPNATVTFNPLLLAFTIPSGGGNNVGVALGTWEEL